jgi:porphobilinogen synthase
MNTTRPRRLRASPLLRNLLASSRLAPSDFVAPLFVRLGSNLKIPIKSMPGIYQYSPDTALEHLRALADGGISSFLLFGITDPGHKDAAGSHAHDESNAVCSTLRAAKDARLPLLAITDLCYCEYTSHGHCGPLTSQGLPAVDNDATITNLGQQAVLHARCGADIIAPSAAMDHMVAAIRSGLDAGGFHHTAILSYAVKYASAFYGPFRDAAESPPQPGSGLSDRKTYQMDYRRHPAEALREAALDVAEGADLLMVKPGLPYLDILKQVADASPVPAAVYHVSGEYAMLKAAAANGWIDERETVLETMHAFKRAGAAFVLTYYAQQLAGWLP